MENTIENCKELGLQGISHKAKNVSSSTSSSQKIACSSLLKDLKDPCDTLTMVPSITNISISSSDQIHSKLRYNAFDRDFFKLELETAGVMKIVKKRESNIDREYKILKRIPNVKICLVLSAKALGIFSDDELFTWLKEGSSLNVMSSLFRDQMEFYRNLSLFLMNHVEPHDTSAWKELLRCANYKPPVTNSYGWSIIFDLDSECNKEFIEKLKMIDKAEIHSPIKKILNEDEMYKEYLISKLVDAKAIQIVAFAPNKSVKCLKRVQRLSTGLVLTAKAAEIFSNYEIWEWIRDSPKQKITALFKDQLTLYKQLSDFLRDQKIPEVLDAWGDLLSTKYIFPEAGQEGWCKIFGTVPILCKTLDIKSIRSDMKLYNISNQVNDKQKLKENGSTTSTNELSKFKSKCEALKYNAKKTGDLEFNEEISINMFNRFYFIGQLRENGILQVMQEGKNKKKFYLKRFHNITIGSVLAAFAIETFTDVEILKWLRLGQKITPVFEKQFSLYRKLSSYLMGKVAQNDVKTWKDLLSSSRYFFPKAGMSGWSLIFENIPELCSKVNFINKIDTHEREKQVIDPMIFLEEIKTNDSKYSKELSAHNSAKKVENTLSNTNIENLSVMNSDENTGSKSHYGEDTSKSISRQKVKHWLGKPKGDLLNPKDLESSSNENKSVCDCSFGSHKLWNENFKDFMFNKQDEICIPRAFFKSLLINASIDKLYRERENITIGILIAAVLENFDLEKIIEWVGKPLNSEERSNLERQLFIYSRLGIYLMNELVSREETACWKHLLISTNYQKPTKKGHIWYDVFGTEIPNINGLSITGKYLLYKADLKENYKSTSVVNNKVEIDVSKFMSSDRDLILYDSVYTKLIIDDTTTVIYERMKTIDNNETVPVFNIQSSKESEGHYLARSKYRALLTKFGTSNKNSKITVGLVMSAVLDPEINTTTIIEMIKNSCPKSWQVSLMQNCNVVESLKTLLKRQFFMFHLLASYILKRACDKDYSYWTEVLLLYYNFPVKENGTLWQQIFSREPNKLNIYLDANWKITSKTQLSDAINAIKECKNVHTFEKTMSENVNIDLIKTEIDSGEESDATQVFDVEEIVYESDNIVDGIVAKTKKVVSDTRKENNKEESLHVEHDSSRMENIESSSTILNQEKEKNCKLQQDKLKMFDNVVERDLSEDPHNGLDISKLPNQKESVSKIASEKNVDEMKIELSREESDIRQNPSLVKKILKSDNACEEYLFNDSGIGNCDSQIDISLSKKKYEIHFGTKDNALQQDFPVDLNKNATIIRELRSSDNTCSDLHNENNTNNSKEDSNSNSGKAKSDCHSTDECTSKNKFKDDLEGYCNKIGSKSSFNSKFYDTEYIPIYTSAKIPRTCDSSSAEEYKETDSKIAYAGDYWSNIDDQLGNSMLVGNQYTTTDQDNYFKSSNDADYNNRDQVAYYNSDNIEKNIEPKHEYNTHGCFNEYLSENGVFTTSAITTIGLEAETSRSILAKPIPTVSTTTRATVQTTYCSALLYDIQEEYFPWTKPNEDEFSHESKAQNPKTVLNDESSSSPLSFEGVGTAIKRKGPLLPTPLPIPKWMLSIPPQLVVPPGPLPLWSCPSQPSVTIPSQTPINIPPPPLYCTARNATTTPPSRPTTRPFTRNPYKWVRPNYFRRGTGSYSFQSRPYRHYTNDDFASKDSIPISDITVFPPGETSIPNLETSHPLFEEHYFQNQIKVEPSDFLEYSSITDSLTLLRFPQEVIKTSFDLDIPHTSYGQPEFKTTLTSLQDQPVNILSLLSSTVPLDIKNDESIRNSGFENCEGECNVDQNLVESGDVNDSGLFISCSKNIVSSFIKENADGSKLISNILENVDHCSKENYSSKYSCSNLVNVTHPIDIEISGLNGNKFEIDSTSASGCELDKSKIYQKEKMEKSKISNSDYQIKELKLDGDYSKDSRKKSVGISNSREISLYSEESKNHQDFIKKLVSLGSSGMKKSYENKELDTKKIAELIVLSKDKFILNKEICEAEDFNSDEYKSLNKDLHQTDESTFNDVNSVTDNISCTGTSTKKSAEDTNKFENTIQNKLNESISSEEKHSIHPSSEIQLPEVSVRKKSKIKHSKIKQSEVNDGETINSKKSVKLEESEIKSKKDTQDSKKREMIDFEKILADIFADDTSKLPKINPKYSVPVEKYKTWIDIFKKPFTVSHNIEMQFTLRYFRTLFVSSGAVNSDKTLKTIPNITVGLVVAALIEEFSEHEILKWLNVSPSQKAFKTQMFIYRQLSYYLMNDLNDYQETLYWKHLLNYIEYQQPAEQYGIWENLFGSEISNIIGLTLKGNLQVYKTHPEEMCKESKKCPVPNHSYHPYPKSSTNTKVPRTANRRKRRKVPVFYSEDNFFTQQTIKFDSHNLNSKVININEPIVKSEHKTTFDNEYFRTLLQTSGIEKTTKSLRNLSKESKLTVGMVMAAMKDPAYETIEIIKWITNYIHKTLESPKCFVKEYLSSLYSLLKKQLLVYKALSCYLMNQAPTEDIKYWERILNLPYHITLKENMAFWEQIFGNLPNELGIGISANCLITVNNNLSDAVKEHQLRNEKAGKDPIDIQLEKEMARIHNNEVEPILLQNVENAIQDVEKLYDSSKTEMKMESNRSIGSILEDELYGDDFSEAVDFTSPKSISFVPRVITNVLLGSSLSSQKKRCSSKYPKLLVKENLNELKTLSESLKPEYSSSLDSQLQKSERLTEVQIALKNMSATGKGIVKNVCPASLPVSIPISTTMLPDHSFKGKDYSDEEKCVNIDIGNINLKKHDKKRVYDKGYFKAFSVRNTNKVNKMANFVEKTSKTKQIHCDSKDSKKQYCEQSSLKELDGSLPGIDDKWDNIKKVMEKTEVSSDIEYENESKIKDINTRKIEYENKQDYLSKAKISKEEINNVDETKTSSKNSKTLLVLDKYKVSEGNGDLVVPQKKTCKKDDKYKSKSSKNEHEETKKRKSHANDSRNSIPEDEKLKKLPIGTNNDCIKEMSENKEIRISFNTLEILNLDLNGDHLFDSIIDIYRGVRQAEAEKGKVLFKFNNQECALFVAKLLQNFRIADRHLRIEVEGFKDQNHYLNPKETISKFRLIHIYSKEDNLFVKYMRDVAANANDFELFAYKTNKCELSSCSKLNNCHNYHNNLEMRRDPRVYNYSDIWCEDHKLENWTNNIEQCSKCHTHNEWYFHLKRIHRDICPEKNCSKILCKDIHSETPSSMLNSIWCDLLVCGLENTYRYLKGAIQNLRHIDTEVSGVYILLLSPSDFMLEWLSIALNDLVRDLKINIASAVESNLERDAQSVHQSIIGVSGVKVLLGTPGAVEKLFQNWKLLCSLQATLCCLILDDGSILLDLHRQQLLAITEALATVKGHPHMELNKVVIVEKIIPEEVISYNKLLNTNLRPVKKITKEVEEINICSKYKCSVDKTSTGSKSGDDKSIYQDLQKEDKVGKTKLPPDKNTQCDKLSKVQRNSQMSRAYQSKSKSLLGNKPNMTAQDKKSVIALPQDENEKKMDICKKNLGSNLKLLNTAKLSHSSEQKHCATDITKKDSSKQTMPRVNCSVNSSTIKDISTNKNYIPNKRLSVVPISKVLSELKDKKSPDKSYSHVTSQKNKDSRSPSVKESSNHPKKKHLHSTAKDSKEIYSDHKVKRGVQKLIRIDDQTKVKTSKKQFSIKEQSKVFLNEISDNKIKKPLISTITEYATTKNTQNQRQKIAVFAQIPNQSSQLGYAIKESHEFSKISKDCKALPIPELIKKRVLESNNDSEVSANELNVNVKSGLKTSVELDKSHKNLKNSIASTCKDLLVSKDTPLSKNYTVSKATTESVSNSVSKATCLPINTYVSTSSSVSCATSLPNFRSESNDMSVSKEIYFSKDPLDTMDPSVLKDALVIKDHYYKKDSSPTKENMLTNDPLLPKNLQNPSQICAPAHTSAPAHSSTPIYTSAPLQTYSSVQTSAPSQQTRNYLLQTSSSSQQTIDPMEKSIASTQQTIAPTQQSNTPMQQSNTPPQQTSTPPQQTSTSPQQTSTPPLKTSAPTQQTSAPTQQTSVPMQKTSAPTQKTSAPTQKSSAPMQKTSAPTQKTSAPTEGTSASTQRTSPPTQQSSPPTQQSSPPTQQSRPPTQQSSPPTQKTRAPTQQTSPRSCASTPPQANIPPQASTPQGSAPSLTNYSSLANDSPLINDKSLTRGPLFTKNSLLIKDPLFNKYPTLNKDTFTNKEPSMTKNSYLTKDDSQTKNPSLPKHHLYTMDQLHTIDLLLTKNTSLIKNPLSAKDPSEIKDGTLSKGSSLLKDLSVSSVTKSPSLNKDPDFANDLSINKDVALAKDHLPNINIFKNIQMSKELPLSDYLLNSKEPIKDTSGSSKDNLTSKEITISKQLPINKDHISAKSVIIDRNIVLSNDTSLSNDLQISQNLSLSKTLIKSKDILITKDQPVSTDLSVSMDILKFKDFLANKKDVLTKPIPVSRVLTLSKNNPVSSDLQVPKNILDSKDNLRGKNNPMSKDILNRKDILVSKDLTVYQDSLDSNDNLLPNVNFAKHIVSKNLSLTKGMPSIDVTLSKDPLACLKDSANSKNVMVSKDFMDSKIPQNSKNILACKEFINSRYLPTSKLSMSTKLNSQNNEKQNKALQTKHNHFKSKVFSENKPIVDSSLFQDRSDEISVMKSISNLKQPKVKSILSIQTKSPIKRQRPQSSTTRDDMHNLSPPQKRKSHSPTKSKPSYNWHKYEDDDEYSEWVDTDVHYYSNEYYIESSKLPSTSVPKQRYNKEHNSVYSYAYKSPSKRSHSPSMSKSPSRRNHSPNWCKESCSNSGRSRKDQWQYASHREHLSPSHDRSQIKYERGDHQRSNSWSDTRLEETSLTERSHSSGKTQESEYNQSSSKWSSYSPDSSRYSTYSRSPYREKANLSPGRYKEYSPSEYERRKCREGFKSRSKMYSQSHSPSRKPYHPHLEIRNFAYKQKSPSSRYCYNDLYEENKSRSPKSRDWSPSSRHLYTSRDKSPSFHQQNLSRRQDVSPSRNRSPSYYNKHASQRHGHQSPSWATSHSKHSPRHYKTSPVKLKQSSESLSPFKLETYYSEITNDAPSLSYEAKKSNREKIVYTSTKISSYSQISFTQSEAKESSSNKFRDSTSVHSSEKQYQNQCINDKMKICTSPCREQRDQSPDISPSVRKRPYSPTMPKVSKKSNSSCCKKKQKYNDYYRSNDKDDEQESPKKSKKSSKKSLLHESNCPKSSKRKSSKSSSKKASKKKKHYESPCSENDMKIQSTSSDSSSIHSQHKNIWKEVTSESINEIQSATTENQSQSLKTTELLQDSFDVQPLISVSVKRETEDILSSKISKIIAPSNISVASCSGESISSNVPYSVPISTCEDPFVNPDDPTVESGRESVDSQSFDKSGHYNIPQPLIQMKKETYQDSEVIDTLETDTTQNCSSSVSKSTCNSTKNKTTQEKAVSIKCELKEFSVLETCLMLKDLCGSMDSVGPSLHLLVNKAHKLGTEEKILEMFSEKEHLLILNIILKKLKGIYSLSGEDKKSVYKNAIDQTEQFMNMLDGNPLGNSDSTIGYESLVSTPPLPSQPPPQQPPPPPLPQENLGQSSSSLLQSSTGEKRYCHGLDLQQVAKVTRNKDMTQVIAFIKNSLEYVGVEYNKEIVSEIVLEVSLLHYNLLDNESGEKSTNGNFMTSTILGSSSQNNLNSSRSAFCYPISHKVERINTEKRIKKEPICNVNNPKVCTIQLKQEIVDKEPEPEIILTRDTRCVETIDVEEWFADREIKKELH